jgi:hypothetical protein
MNEKSCWLKYQKKMSIKKMTISLFEIMLSFYTKKMSTSLFLNKVVYIISFNLIFKAVILSTKVDFLLCLFMLSRNRSLL